MASYEHLNLNEITACEVCGGTTLVEVLDLGLHPMCDDLVPVGDARRCKEYPIVIMYCDTCRTAHQRYQIPKAELFPVTYHYRSRFTADVLQGMKDLVISCETELGSFKGLKVLDVGCNDGSLLDMFRDKGCTAFGIEPTGASEDAAKKGHTIVNAFFSLKTAEAFVKQHGKMDVVTFTNVFAHIEDLQDVIRSLKVVMHDASTLVIENHYLGAVLDRSQFDTFYHEHPRTYSARSFAFIAKSLGTDISNIQFPSRYGGNIRVMMRKGKRLDAATMRKVDDREQKFQSDFAELNRKIASWRTTKTAFIRKHVAATGPIRAKAFPGRAAILVKMLNLSDKEVQCVFEKPGSMKIGHYLPGTRIPILSDDVLFKEVDKNEPILNLAWHIHREIDAYMKQNGHHGELIDILSEEDFRQTA